ncbi:hypothetical protein KY285_014751 [Solanum tuberosum]|nr:hypothetical protein KY285_014751 [Solanum tuberosum]
MFNTVLNFDDKTKDNPQSRQDMVEYCDRPQLAKDSNRKYPKAVYTIDKEARVILFNWVKGLKFPDGYVSNLGRCPDTNAKMIFGMKSHDCHVFMQRLLPIAFRELLPSNVWQALTELSLFFKDLTSTPLRVDDMERLERDIPQILCKLERIFPPGFYDSMEHLPVHLPYEARIAGPVQYRWMYPFERYLGTLKRMIGNKASVEGSICEAYLMTESTQLFSHYFEPHVMTRNHNVDRNDDGWDKEDIEGNLSIFSHPGRLWGEAKKRDLTLEEIKAAQTYILLNCEEVEPFVSMFMQRLQEEFPNLSQGQIDESLEANFSIWFKEFVQCNPIENEFLCSLARGPLIDATCYSAYFVNGYKFHTECHGSTRSTMNSGVCISDPNFAVLKVKPRNVIELPNEEVATVSEVNVPFQVEEVEVHEIDMTISIDENILLNDPNGDVIEMDEPIDDGLLQENHEIHIESTEEEYETEETEETEENEDEEEEEFEEDRMARGRGRGKSSGRSNPAIRVSMPTIPKPTIVSPQQGGTPTNIETATQSISPTISETPPATSNQSNLIGQGFSTQSNSTGRTNTVAESESNSSHTRTLVFLTSAGLEPSQICSSFISKSFKSDVDPNGINWKSVSTDVRNGYFGEFKKKFYWDVSISENEVKRHWMEELSQVMYQKMCGKDGCNFGEVKSVLKSQKLIRKIVVAAMKLLLGLTRAALFQLENITGNLLLKKVEIQHQLNYICMFIHMVMMENHMLVSVLELSIVNLVQF